MAPSLTFKERLERELAKRQRSNARYSLRAFAAFLGADHATLSQILRGKRSVPIDLVRLWARRLKVSDEETAVYEAVARALDEQALSAQETLRRWATEMLCLLTQREHREILRLARSPAFRNDSRWLAEQVGVGIDAINIALSRLLRLGVLKVGSDGIWKDATGLSEITPQAFRRYIAERVPNPLQKGDG